jgi:SagB-type dehydrogenase family enzyme
LHSKGDLRSDLERATFGQHFVSEAAAVLIMTADYEKPHREFGPDGTLYTCMDLGHLGQNVHLQAVSIDVGTVVVGAFGHDRVRSVLRLSEDEDPLYLMPLGRYRYR